MLNAFSGISASSPKISSPLIICKYKRQKGFRGDLSPCPWGNPKDGGYETAGETEFLRTKHRLESKMAEKRRKSRPFCLTHGTAAGKYASRLLKASCPAQPKGCSACFVPPTLKYYSCKSKVCAKTIVIVKDCCLVAGGLCRSMAGRGLVSGSRRTKFRRVDGAELRQSPRQP